MAQEVTPIYRCEICMRSDISRLFRSTVWKIRPLWLCDRCRKLARGIFRAATSIHTLRNNARRLVQSANEGNTVARLRRLEKRAKRKARDARK